jgi:RNA polymerase sigma-70 factor (ECF subfamily)
MTGNKIDAEDMVQETFLKAWKQIGKFDGRAAFGTWLHRIACSGRFRNCAARWTRLVSHRGNECDEASV